MVANNLQNKPTHDTGITQFFDLSIEQFQKTYLSLRLPAFKKYIKNAIPYEFKSETNAPDAHDWREHGAVGPIKDQSQCGSSWAFAITTNLEGINYIKHKQFVSFSEQQILDCDKIDYACSGGSMETGIQYIQQQGGIENDTDYPYTGKYQACKYDASKSAAKVTGYHYAPSKDEGKIRDMIFENGPLAVAINAIPFFDYKGGIVDLDATQCPPTLNHGTALVGYGTENGKDYWILKNFWTINWGEQGYFRIARGKGTCGVNQYVITAEIA